MKLIKGKDFKCKCKVSELEIYKNEEWLHPFLQNYYKFCWNCGDKIEWVEERTVEEVLDELIKESIRYGSIGRGIQENNIDSLKQELLNIIKK